MSKFHARTYPSYATHDQNPSKGISDESVSGFMKIVMEGDIDGMRDYVLNQKINLSSVHIPEIGSAINVAISLDPSVADSETKLQMIKFLAENGVGIDLPDKDNIRPIHLAAKNGEKKIVEYLIEKKVRLDTTDSAGNTPLHYGVMGTDIPCPTLNGPIDGIPATPGSIVPSRRIDEEELNKDLTSATKELMKLISSEQPLKDKMIRIINTISKIPDIYESDKDKLDSLKSDIIKIFTDVSIDPNYANDLKKQQQDLDQLVTKTLSNVNTTFLAKSITPMDIRYGNNGWGLDPNEKILPKDIQEEITAFGTNIDKILKDVGLFRSESFASKLNDDVDFAYEYVKALVFGKDSADVGKGLEAGTYGNDVTKTKMFFLIMYRYIMKNHKEIFVRRIMENYKFMTDGMEQFGRYISSNPYSPPNHLVHSLPPNTIFLKEGRIYGNNILNILAKKINNKGEKGDIIGDMFKNFGERASDVLKKKLKKFFDENDMITYINEEFNKIKYFTPVQLAKKYSLNKSNFDKTLKKKSLFLLLNDMLFLPIPGTTDMIWNKYQSNYTGIKYSTVYPNDIIYPLYVLLLFNLYNKYIIMKKNPGALLGAADKYPDFFNEEINKWDNYILNKYGSDKSDIYIPVIRLFINIFSFILEKRIIESYDTLMNIDKNIIMNPAESLIYKQILKTINLFSLDHAINFLSPHETTVNNTILYRTKLIPFPDDKILSGLDNILGENKNNIIDFISVYMNKFSSRYYADNTAKSFFETNENVIFEVLSRGNSHINHGIWGNIIKILSSRLFENLLNTSYTNTDINNTYKKVIESVEDNNDDVYTGIANISANMDQFYDKITKIDDTITLNLPADPTNPGVGSEPIRQNAKKYLMYSYTTEILLHYFTVITRKIAGLTQMRKEIGYIMDDIYACMPKTHSDDKSFEYFIPQVLLPAIVRYMYIITDEILETQKLIGETKTKIDGIKSKLDISYEPHKQLMMIFDSFNTNIDKKLEEIYQSNKDLVVYHNTIIKSISLVNTYRILYNIFPPPPTYGFPPPPLGPLVRVFSSDLPNISPFPPYTEISNKVKFEKIISDYVIKATYYYSVVPPIPVPEFVLDNKVMTYTGGAPSKNTRYRKTDLEIYDFVGKTGNYISPIIEDLHGHYKITPDIPPVEGTILFYDKTKNSREIKFLGKVISFRDIPYLLDLTQGAPTIISDNMDMYINLQKQDLIQDVITHINTTKATTTKDLWELLDQMSKGNTDMYNKIPEVKNHIIVGKIVDSISINMINYAAKQSVHNLIFNQIKSFSSYDKLIHANLLDMVSPKSWSAISPGTIEKSIIEKVIESAHRKYIVAATSHVEEDPQNMTFFPDKKEKLLSKDNLLVSYLYNINYFKSSTTSVARCYKINPKIINKIITPLSLNTQNFDGMTPLHYAVTMKNPHVVIELINRGAIKNAFPNSAGNTPFSQTKDEIRKHLQIISYETYTSIDNYVGTFAQPFNKLLEERLLDPSSKANGNVVRGVKFAIPIALCIYNHMFNTYIQNYRFGISPDLKNKILNILQKYNLRTSEQNKCVYPIDLFQIDLDSDEFQFVMNSADMNYMSNKTINRTNARKIKGFEKSIGEIDFQIKGLNTELSGEENTEKKDIIREALRKLEDLKKKDEDEIKKLKTVATDTMDIGLRGVYAGLLVTLQKNIEDRSFSEIEFYENSFGRIGRTKKMNLAIWINYMMKKLDRTPSMIFMEIDQLLKKMIADVLPNDEVEVIRDFMKSVKEYIDRRVDLPNDLKNPVNIRELEQIKYIINLIVTPALLGIIYREIETQVREGIQLAGSDDDIYKIMDNITEAKFGEDTIETYMKGTMINSLYKNLTEIYLDKKDPDRKYQLSDIFEPIISAIKANTAFAIDDESLLIKNIKEHIIPFMTNTYRNVIHHIRLAIYGYEKYLLNTFQLVEIYNIMKKN